MAIDINRLTLQQKSVAVAVLTHELPTTRALGEMTVYHGYVSGSTHAGHKHAQRLYYDAARSVVQALARRGIIEQAGTVRGGARMWRVTDEARGVVNCWRSEIDAMPTREGWR